MSAPRLVEGHVIGGKYSIRSLLRWSDVVATYHAVAAPNQQVALKLFDPALHRHLDVVARLAQIYQKVETLRADWFGQVIDVGRDDETGATFTAVALVATPPLSDLVSLCPFDEAEATDFVGALARVLDTAHAAALLHGGLSPGNVFPGATPYASCKVVDFGVNLARRVLARPHDDPTSAQWLAPEQVDRGAETMATDVFALALLAFFALTGRSYWRSCRGKPDLATWGREIREPRTLATANAKELGISLKPALDAVFARALSVSPADRFPNAGAFALAFATAVGREVELEVAPVEGPPVVPPVVEAVVEPSRVAAVAPVFAPEPPNAPPRVAAFEPMPVAAPETPVSAMPAMRETPEAPEMDEAQVTRRRSRVAWIASAAILLVSGAVAAMVVMSGKKHPESAPVIADAKPVATPSAAPAAEEPEDVVDTGVVLAVTPDAGVPAHDAGSDAREAGTGKEVAVSIWCMPACDWIQIDGKNIDLKEPLRLPPGTYIVAVGKTGYLAQSDKLYVKAGKKSAMPFALVRVGAKKPCGKFLKRCD